MSVYFNVLKRVPSSKRELLKRNNHFEEFKKAFNDRKASRLLKERIESSKNDRNDTLGEILKRYGVKHINQKESKPAMRRAPLKTIKTVGIEIPAHCGEEAIIAAPKKRTVETFVDIAKPIRKEKPKVRIKDVAEEKEMSLPESPSKYLIEEQLLQTREEIDMANCQLEQIRSLLNNRKSSLSPVKEEEIEEMEEKTNLVRQVIDRKSSPIQPRTQWTVKSLDNGRTKSKKNKLMSTLNNLNQRLQRIQEKYFNEPKVRYKSISDFIPPRSKETIQTLYKNFEYKRDPSKLVVDPNEDDEVYDHDTIQYVQQLVKRTQKLTKIDKARTPPTENPETSESILVLMPPKGDEPTQSDACISVEENKANNNNNNNRGILKKQCNSTAVIDTVLEAPVLQKSICRSNYLMKEFNVGSDEKSFDLSKLLLPKYDENSSMESLKKNVRFSKYLQRNEANKDTRLYSNIDLALKNSLFYHDEQEAVK